MRRLILILLAAAALAAAVAGCSSPPNNPCAWHSGVRHSSLSQNGKTLVLVCDDGTVVVKHP